MRRRDRAADDAVLRPAPSVDRVREEDATRQRRREAVREPELCVSLGERGRDPTQTCREHHRPGDVPPASQHDVGSPPRQDPPAGDRRADRLPRGANETEADPPREARDGERVELEARLRNELRLDAAARPGERHRHSACAQRLGDCERGPDVPRGPARRDHAPKPSRRVH